VAVTGQQLDFVGQLQTLLEPAGVPPPQSLGTKRFGLGQTAGGQMLPPRLVRIDQVDGHRGPHVQQRDHPEQPHPARRFFDPGRVDDAVNLTEGPDEEERLVRQPADHQVQRGFAMDHLFGPDGQRIAAVARGVPITPSVSGHQAALADAGNVLAAADHGGVHLCGFGFRVEGDQRIRNVGGMK